MLPAVRMTSTEFFSIRCKVRTADIFSGCTTSGDLATRRLPNDQNRNASQFTGVSCGQSLGLTSKRIRKNKQQQKSRPSRSALCLLSVSLNPSMVSIFGCIHQAGLICAALCKPVSLRSARPACPWLPGISRSGSTRCPSC